MGHLMRYLLGMLLAPVVHGNVVSMLRQLQDGSNDFAELNEILKRAVLNIGGGSVSEGLVLDASIENFECRNAQLSDASVDSMIPTDDYIQVNLSITNVSTQCSFRYSYRTLLFRGSGTGSVSLRGNRASVGWRVKKSLPNLPSQAFVLSCSASIAIESLSFDKGLLGLAPAETLLRRVLQNRAEDAFCNFLSETKIPQDTLRQFNTLLAPYQGNWIVDPLSEEKSDTFSYLNFQSDPTTKTGKFIRWILDELTSFLSSFSNSDSSTMRINEFLRTYVLEQDGSVTIDDIPWEGIFTEDRLTRTTLELDSMRLIGLDSLSQLHPLQIVGENTLQTNLSFENLSIMMNATVTIRPSKASNAFVTVPGPPAPPVVENIQVIASWSQVNATAALFLPVQQQPDLLLGSLLRMNHIAPCLLSLLGNSTPVLTSLSVSFLDVRPPTLQGFVSKGIDRVVSSLSLAFVQMYKEPLLGILPNVFQQKILPAVNSAIKDRLLALPRDCPTPVASRRGILDLRQLVQAETSPYGDVIPKLYNAFSDRFVHPNQKGFPKINEALIWPISKAQSGIEGQLHFTKGDLIDYKWSEPNFPTLVDQVRFRVSSPRVENLDSVVSPLRLLEFMDAKTLRNSIRMGRVEDKRLTFNSELMFVMEKQGATSPLSVDNTYGVSVSLETTVDTVVIFPVKEEDFLNFHLSNMLDPFCWLEVLQRDTDGGLGLSLQSVGVDLKLTDVLLECWYCTSLGGDVLTEVVDIVKRSEILQYVEAMMERSIEEFGRTYFNMIVNYFGNELRERKCVATTTSSSSDAMSKPMTLPPYPPLSIQSVDSLVVTGMLGMHTLLIVVTKSHLGDQFENCCLPPKSNLSKPGLVNWMDLNSTVGSWAFDALEHVQDLTGSMKQTEFGIEPGLNDLIRNFMDDQRRLRIPGPLGIGFSVMNTTIFLENISITGLDTTSDVHLFEPLSPHRFGSRVKLSSLEIVVSLTAQSNDYPDGIPLQMTFSLSNIAIEVKARLEINWSKLGLVKVGSVAKLQRIFPCFVSNIDAFTIEGLGFEAKNLSPPVVVGLSGSVANDALTSINENLFKQFSNDIVQGIPKIFNSTIRNAFNAMLDDLRTDGDTFCTYDDTVAVSAQEAIDFRDLLADQHGAKELGGQGNEPYGGTIPRLLAMIRSKLSSDDPSGGLNEAFIRPLTLRQSGQPGTLNFSGPLVFNQGQAAISRWNFNYIFRIHDLKIENLDSIGPPITLLEPIEGEAHSVNSSVALGTNSRPITLSANVYVKLFDKQGNLIENDVAVELKIKNLLLATIVSFQLSEALFFGTPIGNLLNHPDCWIASVLTTPDAPALNYNFGAEEVNLTITCNECKTPRFDELVQRLYDVGDTSQELESFISSAIDIADRFLSSTFLQDIFASLVKEAKLSCPSSPQFDPNHTGKVYFGKPDASFGFDPMKRDPKMKIFNIVSAGLLSILLVTLLVTKFILSRRRTKWRNTLAEDRAILLQQYEMSSDAQSLFLDQNTKAMYENSSIATRMRSLVPILLFLDFILYLVAHFATLSYINVNANIAGDEIQIKRLIEFSFFEAAMRTYRSGGNEMALMIIIFSGIWPYFKIMASLFLWFAPPTTVTVKRRGTILLWMDVLTKLSIVDIAMMMILIATLLLLVGGPKDTDEYKTHEDLYSLVIVVVPQAGFYCILIAQRLNRVSSRVLLECQEAIVIAANRAYYQSASVEKSDAFHEASVEQPVGHYPTLLPVQMTETSSTESMSLSISPSYHASADCSAEFHGKNCSIEQHGEDESLRRHPSVDSSFVENPPSRSGNQCLLAVEESGLRKPGSKLFLGNLFHTSHARRTSNEFVKIPWSVATCGAALACLCVFVLFIIGCAMAPSIVMDSKEILGITLESGRRRSFNEAMATFNVYQLVCAVLLSSRFLLSSRADYVGLVLLLSIVALASLALPLFEGVQAARQWFKTHSFSTPKTNGTGEFSDEIRLPLLLWPPLLIYLISFCMAIWQLGAVWAYVIHNFCYLSGILFTALQYIGIIKEDEKRLQCFREQASTTWSLLILFGSFLALVVKFLTEVSGQHKKSTSLHHLPIEDNHQGD